MYYTQFCYLIQLTNQILSVLSDKSLDRIVVSFVTRFFNLPSTHIYDIFMISELKLFPFFYYYNWLKLDDRVMIHTDTSRFCFYDFCF